MAAALSDAHEMLVHLKLKLSARGSWQIGATVWYVVTLSRKDVGREDRFPLGTRLREDRARVVNAARARSPFPGTPVAVAWDPRLKTALKQRERRRCSSSRRRSAHRDKLGAAVLAAAAAAAASPLASVTAALHLAAASL